MRLSEIGGLALRICTDVNLNLLTDNLTSRVQSPLPYTRLLVYFYHHKSVSVSVYFNFISLDWKKTILQHA